MAEIKVYLKVSAQPYYLQLFFILLLSQRCRKSYLYPLSLPLPKACLRLGRLLMKNGCFRTNNMEWCLVQEYQQQNINI